jgi:hypothetical protein
MRTPINEVKVDEHKVHEGEGECDGGFGAVKATSDKAVEMIHDGRAYYKIIYPAPAITFFLYPSF